MVWEATFLLRILYKFSVSKEVQTLANLFNVYISCVNFFFFLTFSEAQGQLVEGGEGEKRRCKSCELRSGTTSYS